jgi:hypothetical protein
MDEGKKDPIIEGIESGRIYGMKCEPLKDNFENLKNCPDREECEVLSNHLTWINEMEDIVRDLHCGFCESPSWIFVGITKDGTMVRATMTEKHAKKINELIETKRSN